MTKFNVQKLNKKYSINGKILRRSKKFNSECRFVAKYKSFIFKADYKRAKSSSLYEQTKTEIGLYQKIPDTLKVYLPKMIAYGKFEDNTYWTIQEMIIKSDDDSLSHEELQEFTSVKYKLAKHLNLTDVFYSGHDGCCNFCKTKDGKFKIFDYAI